GQWHETRLGQHVAQRGSLPQRLAQRRQVARAAAAEAEAGQTSLDVRATLQPLAQGLAQLRAVHKELDCVEARRDRGRLRQRRREMIGEETRPGGRNGPIDYRDNAALALAGEGWATCELRTG